MICEYCMEEFTPKNKKQKACNTCIEEGYAKQENDKNNIWVKNYQNKLKKQGLCIACREPMDREGSRCTKCTEKQKEISKSIREEDRARYNAYHNDYYKANRDKISEKRKILREKAKQTRIYETIHQ